MRIIAEVRITNQTLHFCRAFMTWDRSKDEQWFTLINFSSEDLLIDLREVYDNPYGLAAIVASTSGMCGDK